MTEPDHRCGRGPNCADPERDDQGRPIGAATDRDLCRACTDTLPDILNTAPATHAELTAAARRRGSAPPGRKKQKITGSPLGFTLAPYHLAEQLHWWITAWADVIIYTAGRPTPDRARQPADQQIADACALLDTYLSAWIAHGPVDFWVRRTNADPDDHKTQPTGDMVTETLAGWQGCAWFLDWDQATQRVLGRIPLTHYPTEPCPFCRQQGGLRRRDGADKVRCTWCNHSWTLDTWDVFVHAWTRHAEPAPPPEHHGPQAAVDGQDTRAGRAAHTWDDEGAA